MAKKDKPKLTPKQELFVLEYMKDLNATQAAIRAGYSAKTARDMGCQNLAKPNIQAAIDEQKTKRAAKVGVDAEWVVKRLMAIADANTSQVMEWDEGGVTLKDSKDLSWAEAYTISEVSLKETIKETGGGDELVLHREKKVKQADKLKALEMLAKHTGVFEQQSDGDVPDLKDALSEDEMVIAIRRVTGK